MNWKKISIFISILLFTGFILNLGLKIWLKNSLPEFIKEKNDTPYNFEYSDVSYSLFSRKMEIKGITIEPKEKEGAYHVKVKNITISKVHFLTFFMNKDLKADLIEIEQPDITIKQDFKSIDRTKEVKNYNLGNSIQIENFVIKKGSLQLLDPDSGKKTASLKNLNLHLAGVIWDVADKEKRIPVSYKKVKLSIKEIFYQLNEIHHVNIGEIQLENNYIEAKRAELKSEITEKQFAEGNYLQRKIMNMQIPSAEINQLDWGYNTKGLFYVNTSNININSADIRIQGNRKRIPEASVTAYIERLIPFDLKVDSINILKSKFNLDNCVISDNINLSIEGINNKIEDKITINNFSVYNNHLSVYHQPKKEVDSHSEFTYFFEDLLEIKNFGLRNIHFQLFDVNREEILNMKSINYNMNDIVINTLITNTRKEIPFTYKSYNLNADSTYYTGVKNYSFKIKKMQLANDIFHAGQLEIIPKLSRTAFANQKSGKFLIKAQVDKIDIPKINWSITNNLFTIQAPSVVVNKINAEIYQNKSGKQTNKIKLANSDLGIEVAIGQFSLLNSSIKMYEAVSGELQSSSKEINLKVNTIVFNETSKNNTFQLPVSFTKFDIAAKGNFQNSPYHTLNFENIHLTNNSLFVSGLKMQPKTNKQKIMKETGVDAYSLYLDKLDIPVLDLGFPDKELQWVAPLLTIQKLKATIHQYNIPDADYKPVLKPLHSKLLRDFNFKLQIGQVNIKDSYLSYEEESMDKGVGKIYFTEVNAGIKNISSSYKVSVLPDTEIKFNSKFMYTATLDADWKFNVLNSEDAFTVKGKIKHLPAEKIDMFIKPYLHVSAEGDIDEAAFDFIGNDEKGNGTFGMNYKNMKVTIYKANGKKEKKLLSSLANMALKNDTKDSLIVLKIKEVKRSKDKSFFNFLWKMTLSGLKKNLF